MYTFPAALIRQLQKTRLRVALLILGMMIGFSIPPLYNSFDAGDNMDYNLWQRTGQITLAGQDIYPTDGSKFPFMYPPPCATLLAPISPLPEFLFVASLALLNSIAWAACILFSVYLVTGNWRNAHPALYLWPSVAVIPLVHNTYLLGQPALLLLALTLGCFALLRRGNPFSGGILLALAVAIKAYPLIVAGYLVYRRQWKALAGLVCGLVLIFTVLPLVFRTPAQVQKDITTWSQGMLFKTGEKGIAQRPARSLGFKNQSMQAVVYRLLRPVPADGEGGGDKTWRVNILNLSYGQANVVFALGVLVLLIFYAGATWGSGPPPQPTGDALEMGMAVILGIILAPLSFQYSYVWLLFPVTTLLYLAISAPQKSCLRHAAAISLGTCVFFLLWSIPITRVAAAYGNIFFSGVALYVGSAVILRSGWLRTS